jgi:hypothetical protein
MRGVMQLSPLASKRLIVLFCGCLLAASAFGQQTPGINVGKAEVAFTEAKTLSDADGGRLWGKPLYGPMLFVLPSTHEVVANEADPEGKLHAQADVYIGTLPKDMILANTAVDWDGKRWTMVLWPLSDSAIPRGRLLMHELFHRIQPSLGLKLASPENAQLDSLDGRLWLQLEWRALALAVTQTGAAQHQAIADTLAFRAKRFSLFPQAERSESALEMNEGLAEYTGVRLSSPDLPSARWRILQRLISPDSNTFVRSFAYVSGPAYGLLLDQFDPNWRVGLQPGNDLATMLENSSKVRPSVAVTSRATIYGYLALMVGEQERATNAAEGKARYTALLVDGPTLTLPNAGKSNYGFNPNELVPLGAAGTVYPSMQVSDAWGSLDVEDGALLSTDFNKITVAAPLATGSSPLKGPGWTLTLSAGWRVTPSLDKKGSYVLAK